MVYSSYTHYKPPNSGERNLAFISDLHMGLGLNKHGKYHRWEDFRWPNALNGLLDYLEKWGNGQVDLVIVGDFLELWQPPDSRACPDQDAELGCSVEEMKKIADHVVNAHKDSIRALTGFAEYKENRIHIIPGNHDSALLLAPVWNILVRKLDPKSTGRVTLVKTGTWTSKDGDIVVEHGHQMGMDANSYKGAWPMRITRSDGNAERIIRPWGERFVQKIFNDQEYSHPIIDNLSPETAAVGYYKETRNLFQEAYDIARFIAFNLFETSLTQKIQGLGRGKGNAEMTWDVNAGRDLGYQLFAYALPKDNWVRKLIEPIDKECGTDECKEIRKQLTKLATDKNEVSDAAVESLCEQIYINLEQNYCGDVLGAGAEKLFSSRPRIERGHLNKVKDKFPNMTTFIYGHTHELKEANCVKLNDNREVDVLNTGAFQRVITKDDYKARIAIKKRIPKYSALDTGTGLSCLTLEVDFKSCYTVVLAPFKKGVHRAKTWRWDQKEDSNKGKLLEVGHPDCHWARFPKREPVNRCN